MNIVTTPSRVLAEELKKVVSKISVTAHIAKQDYVLLLNMSNWIICMYIFIALFNSDVYDLWVIQNAITNKRFVLQKSSLIPTLLSVQTMLVSRMCNILVIYVSNGPLSYVLVIMRGLCSHCLIFLPSKLYKQQHWHRLHYRTVL